MRNPARSCCTARRPEYSGLTAGINDNPTMIDWFRWQTCRCEAYPGRAGHCRLFLDSRLELSVWHPHSSRTFRQARRHAGTQTTVSAAISSSRLRLRGRPLAARVETLAVSWNMQGETVRARGSLRLSSPLHRFQRQRLNRRRGVVRSCWPDVWTSRRDPRVRSGYGLRLLAVVVCMQDLFSTHSFPSLELPGNMNSYAERSILPCFRSHRDQCSRCSRQSRQSDGSGKKWPHHCRPARTYRDDLRRVRDDRHLATS